MAILEERDVADLADLLALMHDDAETGLPWPFLERLKALIDCECVSFERKDSRRRIHHVLQAHDWDDEEFYTDGSEFSPEDEALNWEYYWDCEPCSYPERSGDTTSVIQISDFCTPRRWHSTPMYTEFHAPIQHEMLLTIPDGPGRSVRLLCLRESGPEFGDRERFLLSLLRPHIAEAYRAGVRRRSGPPPLTRRLVELHEL